MSGKPDVRIEKKNSNSYFVKNCRVTIIIVSMMKMKISILLIPFSVFGCSKNSERTRVSIKDTSFLINGELTYKGRFWNNARIEGLLLNSRMVQGIFDDLNPETRSRFAYPDTKTWDPDRNTNEFISHMKDWHDNGLLAFTLNLQGGSPFGYGNGEWVNSAYDETGELRPAYMQRLRKILDKADDLGMVVILGYFYFGQDQNLKDENAVINATDNITNWIIDNEYKNILVEINNECNIEYDHPILQPDRVDELIRRVQESGKGEQRLMVSASFGGGTVPSPNVVSASDFILLHGNGLDRSSEIRDLIEKTRKVGNAATKPLLFNEDDHYNFISDTCNFVTAVRDYVSWGYFDYRMDGEGFESGYQSVPVDWGINSERKKSFFRKLEEITMGEQGK
jgi:hypothetical protein